MPAPQQPSPLMTAVLAALAGVRQGQRVLVLGEAALLRRALSAGADCDVVAAGPADVVVALQATDVPGAVSQLVPGGRLVGLAADLGAAARTAERHDLDLQHTEPVDGRVAWSARQRT